MIRLYRLIEKNTVRYVYYPLGIYWIILFILTSLPSDSFIDTFKFSDKIKHFAAYLILSLLLSLAFHFQEKWEAVKKKFYLYSVVAISVYGCLDEIHQMFIPNRSAEVLDWVADVTGAVLGALVIYLFIKNAVYLSKQGTNL